MKGSWEDTTGAAYNRIDASIDGKYQYEASYKFFDEFYPIRVASSNFLASIRLEK